jgi:hypothetical protein
MTMEARIRTIGALFLGLSLSVAGRAQQVFRTSGLEVGIGGRGEILRLADVKGGRSYAPEGPSGYLLRVRTVDGAELRPAGLNAARGRLVFAFDGGIELQVLAAEKPDYLRFELVRVVHPERVDAVLWGPIHTTIGETVGEVVGVVRRTRRERRAAGRPRRRRRSVRAFRRSASTRPGTAS